MSNSQSISFGKCNHKEAPFYMVSYRRLNIGYIVYKVRCLECGKEFEVYTTERKSEVSGMVYKSIGEIPYKVPCDWSYEDVKEAYDLMKEQTIERHAYGTLYLAYFLRKSFGYSNKN